MPKAWAMGTANTSTMTNMSTEMDEVAPDAVPQRLANAIDVVGAVAEPEQRLQGDGDADERHDRELPDALHHATMAASASSAPMGVRPRKEHQLEADDEVHDGHARLHAEARQPRRREW